MIITATDGVEGRAVADCLGIVSGEAVMGTNLFRDIFAGITDLVGGRSGGYEDELRKAKDAAIGQMSKASRALGADAVVGVDLDYERLGGGNRSMLMITADGTAVQLR